MTTEKQVSKPSSEFQPKSSPGSLLSFDEFDNFFDDFFIEKMAAFIGLEFSFKRGARLTES